MYQMMCNNPTLGWGVDITSTDNFLKDNLVLLTNHDTRPDTSMVSGSTAKNCGPDYIASGFVQSHYCWPLSFGTGLPETNTNVEGTSTLYDRIANTMSFPRGT